MVLAVPVTVSHGFDRNVSTLVTELLSQEYNMDEDCHTYYDKFREQKAKGVIKEAPRTVSFKARAKDSALSRILGEEHSVGWCSEPNSPLAHAHRLGGRPGRCDLRGPEGPFKKIGAPRHL